MDNLKQKSKALLRESLLLTKEVLYSHASPKVLMFPDQGRWSGSSMLWCWELASRLRAHSWNTIIVPPSFSLHQRKRVIRTVKPDIILMLKSRHKYNDPELYAPIPVVYIIDDADYADPKMTDRVASACKTSVCVIAGNRSVRDWCLQFNSQVHVVWVSHPVPHVWPARKPSERDPVVLWAHASPLGYPHEAALVQDVLIRAAKEIHFKFHLYGCSGRDEKTRRYCEPLTKAGIEVVLQPYIRRYTNYLKSLKVGACGLHPVCLENPFSHGKSFGKSLAYLATDVPVVTSDNPDHSLFFRHGVNGMTPRNTSQWVEAIVKLIREPTLRDKLAFTARSDFERELSTERCAALVSKLMYNVIG